MEEKKIAVVKPFFKCIICSKFNLKDVCEECLNALDDDNDIEISDTETIDNDGLQENANNDDIIVVSDNESDGNVNSDNIDNEIIVITENEETLRK